MKTAAVESTNQEMVDGGQAEAIAKELRELARLAPVDVRTASIAQIMDWARRVRRVLPRAEGALLHLDRLVAAFDAVTSDPRAEVDALNLFDE